MILTRAGSRVTLNILLISFLCNQSSFCAESASPRFPKPNPANAFSELKIFDQGGSPFRIPQEDWDGARKRALEMPDWQRWVDAQQKEVDRWITQRHDKVEWHAGWWHDFVSPKDGSFLNWTPDEPGEYTLSSASDRSVKLTPKLHGAWVFGFRSRHAAKMEESALLYRLTGDRKYAEWTAAQVDFYATNLFRWETNPLRSHKLSRIMYQSLDEAVNLIRYVTAIRHLGEYVTAEKKSQWHSLFFKPEAELLEKSLQRIHNIGCWHRAAVAHVALYFDDTGLWQQAINGPFGIRKQMQEGVTSDYFWFEQSLTYNSYVVSSLLSLFEYAAIKGKANELMNEFCTLQNLALSPIFIRFPTGQLPNPADSTGGLSFAPNLQLLASISRLYPTELGLNAAARQKSWSNLLDPPRPVGTPKPLPEITSRNMKSSRMAILRKDHWQVYFHYGQVDSSHAQAEALNYEAFYDKADLTHDPGTVGYGSPMHRGYYTTGLAHNVPLVNGLGQEGWHPGELILYDQPHNHIAGSQLFYRKDATASRHLSITNNSLVDVVDIALRKTDKTAKLGLALHLQGKVDIQGSILEQAVAASGLPSASFQYWQNARTILLTQPAELKVRFGELAFRLILKTQGSYRLVHAITPDVPPLKRESLYLEQEGSQTTFTTIWEPID